MLMPLSNLVGSVKASEGFGSTRDRGDGDDEAHYGTHVIGIAAKIGRC